VNILRCLLSAILVLAVCSCSSRKGPKSSATIHEGDTNPGIRMHEEGPGSPVGE
jgi:hypothetical protein